MSIIIDGALQEVLERIYKDYLPSNEGALPVYIPELAKVNPDLFAISITDIHGKTMSVGDADVAFTLQSLAKPFAFAAALETYGMDAVRGYVGVEPTGEPFHSIIRLDDESKRPYNPLVNTGAIAMMDLIGGHGMPERLQTLDKIFEQYIGRDNIEVDEAVMNSEKETGDRNRAIAYLMRHFEMISPRIDETLDLYFHQCSLKVTSVDLSVMAATLANGGVNPLTQERALSEKYIKNVLTLMLTCGLYTYAGEWAFEIGLPAKSGVCGGLLIVVPGKMGIGIYSPLLDGHGNSVRGVLVAKELSNAYNLHILGSG
tara:strand:- start:242 stop:1186 length:945 start_codon:yes stop_codon:yes gene_type:complete